MVICDLLGVELEERDFPRGWARDFGRLIYGASSRGEDCLTAVARALLHRCPRMRLVSSEHRWRPTVVDRSLLELQVMLD